MLFLRPYLIQNKKSSYSEVPPRTDVESPPKVPTRGFGEPPERCTQGSARLTLRRCKVPSKGVPKAEGCAPRYRQEILSVVKISVSSEKRVVNKELCAEQKKNKLILICKSSSFLIFQKMSQI